MIHDLGIVIVNWNTSDLLRVCLETVFASNGVSLQVVVVDNASNDDSAQMVMENFPQVTLIQNEDNEGYPSANNRGLDALGYKGKGKVCDDSPRYALLLNPDTELPSDSLRIMVDFMDTHPKVGIAGPKLVLRDGSLDKACRRSFPTPAVSFYHYSGLARLFPNSKRFGRYNMTFADPDETLEVDSVVGAYMQLRKEVINEIGLLDETFFMYGEDLDWAWRAKQAGWQVWYYPEAIVHHMKRAASTKSPKAQFEFYRAMLLFYRKHYRQQTSLPVHGMILTAILMKGGGALWQEIRHPSRQLPPR